MHVSCCHIVYFTFTTHSSSHLRVPYASQSITDIIGNVSGLVTNIIYPHCIISCINCIGHYSSNNGRPKTTQRAVFCNISNSDVKIAGVQC